MHRTNTGCMLRLGGFLQTTVSGVKGTATLGQQITVCSSDVYVIDSLLLPAATITAVPSVLNASERLTGAQ